MYWIKLCPEWIGVDGGAFHHVSKNSHRWTLDISDEDAIKLIFRIGKGNFASASLDAESTPLPTIKVTPQFTIADPKEGDSTPSMSQRLEEIIASFMQGEDE
ncbi:MAG: hypothetical protein JWO07_86 [Candidatus Saccharibacteria bacterium]|nr:hypothetical protein [Candidatus Saccharibacteria bacterium]